jgi:hypothetical protein
LLGGLGAGFGTLFLAFFASGAGPGDKLVFFDQGGVEELGDGILDSVWVIAIVVLEPEEFDQGVDGFFADREVDEAEAVFAAFAQAACSRG